MIGPGSILGVGLLGVAATRALLPAPRDSAFITLSVEVGEGGT